MTRCIACGNGRTEEVYNPGPQPLAALNLPKSRTEAWEAKRFPMNFHVCCRCGHIFNVEFDVSKIPYSTDNNLMYNSGDGWRRHMLQVINRVRVNMRSDFYTEPHLDIGAGDGQFLEMVRAMQRRNNMGKSSRMIAFEPGKASGDCCEKKLETFREYFVPERDFRHIDPGVIYLRHVLEHLEQPRDFVADILYWMRHYDVAGDMLVCEVPNIEPALATGRVSDFLYEHVSNFTPTSFKTMFEAAGWTTMEIRTMYNDEVILWIGRPKEQETWIESKKLVDRFKKNFAVSSKRLTDEIETCRYAEGWNVVLWGGTGKSAAFINAYGLDDCGVVDSDEAKVGKFVPGTGQIIQHSSSLVDAQVDVLVITTRWRAADIYAEIKERGIKYEKLLIVDGDAVREYTEVDYVAEKNTK